MKKRAFALAVACALTLTACVNQAGPQPGPSTGEPRDKCPDPNGNPCR